MILSPKEKLSFMENGFLHMKGLLPASYVERMLIEIWDELDELFGIKREDRSTWRMPPHSLRKAKYSKTDRELFNSDFSKVINELLGHSQWNEPKSWGGFLIDFPDESKSEYRLHKKMWHWDYEFHRPRLDGLLIFTFFSNAGPKGGGTLIIQGSHILLEKHRASLSESERNQKHSHQRRRILQTHPYFQEMCSPKYNETSRNRVFMKQPWIHKGIPLQIVELLGEPGDVVFCHPHLIHAPSGINTSDEPRIMRSKFFW